MRTSGSTKAPDVLPGTGLGLANTARAPDELARKGMAPDQDG